MTAGLPKRDNAFAGPVFCDWILILFEVIPVSHKLLVASWTIRVLGDITLGEKYKIPCQDQQAAIQERS